MGKQKDPKDPTTPAGSSEPAKRQRGKLSLAQILAPFLPKLKAWADKDYEEIRFNKDASDEQLRSADKLRQVLADLGGPVTSGAPKS